MYPIENEEQVYKLILYISGSQIARKKIIVIYPTIEISSKKKRLKLFSLLRVENNGKILIKETQVLKEKKVSYFWKINLLV